MSFQIADVDDGQQWVGGKNAAGDRRLKNWSSDCLNDPLHMRRSTHAAVAGFPSVICKAVAAKCA